ncbi:MAG: response regulator transcription factor [Nocardioidaceae bacterium]
MSGAGRILVVEDEVRLASAIQRGLEERGLAVEVTHDASEAYRWVKLETYDVLVLDLVLPGLPGIELCRRMRREGLWTPIIVLTAKDRDADETDCLDAGADDYLRKPFSFSVLVARCRALARRGPVAMPALLAVGELSLNPSRRTVRRGDSTIPLTRREFALLEYLMRHYGEVRSKEDILLDVWGGAPGRDPNLVEVYIGYLRRKLDEPFADKLLRTVRGKGYRLDPVLNGDAPSSSGVSSLAAAPD